MKRNFLAGLLCLALSLISVPAIAGSSAYKSSAFGYAAGTTGGGNASPTLVTSASALQTALNSSTSAVIIITKDITVTNHISVTAKNKTLMALPGVKLISYQQNSSSSGILYFKKGSSNIILRNLTFVGPGAYDCNGWDNLCFDGVTKAWVDHCDFQDGCDGNFDNKGVTDNITVSWCRFRYQKSPKAGGSGGTDDHRFSNLVGSSSSDKPSDGKFSMTWAYCWWDEGCVERMVRCRNAEMHFLNCSWTSSAAHYYVGPENTSAQFDGCYFGTPSKPVSKNYIYYQNYGGTNTCRFNNCQGNSSYMQNVGNATWPSYSFNTLSASTAKSELASYAGATLNVTTGGSVSEKGSSTGGNSDGGTPSTVSDYIVVTANSASSLISAINTANSKASSSARAYIFVPNGTYDLGQAYNTKVSGYVSIIGQSRDGVIIRNTPATEGLGTTATLYTTGSNIYMQDVTLKCRASYNSSTKAERGVAWWDHGTKNIMKNVCLDGTQDTYWSNGSQGMLAYFEGGYIKGTTDFICGSGSVFFNSVNIYCQNSSVKSSGDCITAPSTYASEKGYVFHYCGISGEWSQNGTYNLGRPWQNSPACAWLNTKFMIQPSSAGWTKMNSGLVLRFHEYNNTYNGSAVTNHSLSALGGASGSESLYLWSTSGYGLTDVLGSWGQTAYQSCAQLSAPTPYFSGATLSWSAVNGAKAYLIERDGQFVAITKNTSYTVSATGSYTIRVANAMGGFGSAGGSASYSGNAGGSGNSGNTGGSGTNNANSITWDFSRFTTKLILTGDNYEYYYDGLKLVGNTSSTYTNDYVTTGGFHCNGASASNTRMIRYTPRTNGTLTVYFKSNNASDNNRTTAIGTGIGKPIVQAKCDVGVVSTYAAQGTTYYMYFVSGGQTITKVVFTPANGAKEMDADFAEATGIDEVQKPKTVFETVYDAYGRRYASVDAVPQGSMYIRNGRKYVK